MLAQITTATSAAAGIAIALVTAVAAVTKKYIGRKDSAKPECVTRAEFHHEITAIRDRIGASYLAMADKLAAHHRDLLTVLERQGANFEHRLDQLDSGLARLDERTRP